MNSKGGIRYLQLSSNSMAGINDIDNNEKYPNVTAVVSGLSNYSHFIVGSPPFFTKTQLPSSLEIIRKNIDFFKNRNCILKATTYFTSRVPVDMCDVARSTFTDADPFACKHVINIHKVIVGGHGKVFSCIYTEKGAVTIKTFYVRCGFCKLSILERGKCQGNHENSPLL